MSQEHLKILLIEHDSGFTRAVGDMLGQARDLAAEISAVPNLNTGFTALAENNFDVVVLDVSVPDGAGLGNIPLLKAKAPQLPIIAAGDADNETVAVEAVQAGAQDYLVKSQLTAGWLERSIRYAIERHRMDVALLAAEEKYHSIFDHLVEGIFQTTPDGRLLLANAALARIYGYATPEELTRSLTDIGQSLYVQPGRRDEFVRLMQEHNTLSGFESEIYRKDGSRIWISENCRAIRDARSNLLYYEGTVEDITQRRQIEEHLRRSETLYHSLVETIPQSIFRKDLQGRYTFVNSQFCKILGKSYEEVIGKTIADFLPPDQALQRDLADRQVIESRKPFQAVEENTFSGDQQTYIQVIKLPIFDAEGNVTGLQGMFWDITEQRLAEERIRRANAALAQSRKDLHFKTLQMEDDLKMAREIQLTMLPQQYPVFPRDALPENSALHFTHRYLPTSAVGGDFFTISALSDNEAGMFICDVAGHGVRSSLVTAMIRALVEELKPLAADPGQFMTKLNHDLHTILKHAGTPTLTTAFYLVANWKEGTMRYTNAGHPKPLHLHRSEVSIEPLQNIGGKSQAALGLFPEAVYQTSEVRLAPNDLVMMFTDGLYEVQGANDELFSQGMLVNSVQKRLHLPAWQLFDELLEEVRNYSGDGKFADDVCLVGMEVSEVNRSFEIML